MTAIVFAMITVLALAMGVTLVTAVGVHGKWRGANPGLAGRFSAVARHMNGDAEPPPALVGLLDRR